MNSSMFAAVLVPSDRDAGAGYGGTIELTFGDAPVMEWYITVEQARSFASDTTLIDRFVASRFRDLFEKVERLPYE